VLLALPYDGLHFHRFENGACSALGRVAPPTPLRLPTLVCPRCVQVFPTVHDDDGYDSDGNYAGTYYDDEDRVLDKDALNVPTTRKQKPRRTRAAIPTPKKARQISAMQKLSGSEDSPDISLGTSSSDESYAGGGAPSKVVCPACLPRGGCGAPSLYFSPVPTSHPHPHPGPLFCAQKKLKVPGKTTKAALHRVEDVEESADGSPVVEVDPAVAKEERQLHKAGKVNFKWNEASSAALIDTGAFVISL
jgi:hypothetical protein